MNLSWFAPMSVPKSNTRLQGTNARSLIQAATVSCVVQEARGLEANDTCGPDGPVGPPAKSSAPPSRPVIRVGPLTSTVGIAMSDESLVVAPVVSSNRQYE